MGGRQARRRRASAGRPARSTVRSRATDDHGGDDRRPRHEVASQPQESRQVADRDVELAAIPGRGGPSARRRGPTPRAAMAWGSGPSPRGPPGTRTAAAAGPSRACGSPCHTRHQPRRSSAAGTEFGSFLRRLLDRREAALIDARRPACGSHGPGPRGSRLPSELELEQGFQVPRRRVLLGRGARRRTWRHRTARCFTSQVGGRVTASGRLGDGTCRPITGLLDLRAVPVGGRRTDIARRPARPPRSPPGRSPGSASRRRRACRRPPSSSRCRPARRPSPRRSPRGPPAPSRRSTRPGSSPVRGSVTRRR